MTHNPVRLAALKGASVPRAERVAATEAARKSGTNVAATPEPVSVHRVPRAQYFIGQEDDGEFDNPFFNDYGN